MYIPWQLLCYATHIDCFPLQLTTSSEAFILHSQTHTYTHIHTHMHILHCVFETFLNFLIVLLQAIDKKLDQGLGGAETLS